MTCRSENVLWLFDVLVTVVACGMFSPVQYCSCPQCGLGKGLLQLGSEG